MGDKLLNPFTQSKGEPNFPNHPPPTAPAPHPSLKEAERKFQRDIAKYRTAPGPQKPSPK